MSLVINFLTGAPRTPVPAAPDPLAKGDGRFGNLLSDLWEREDQASGFLGQGSSAMGDGGQGVSDTAADIFNQHGLLAKDATVATPAATSATPASAPMAGIVLASEADVAVNDPQPAYPPASTGPIASAIPQRVEAPAPPPSPAVVESSALVSSRNAGIEPVAMEAVPVAASRGAGHPLFAARPSALTAARSPLLADPNAEGLDDVQLERPKTSRRDVPSGGAVSDTQLTLHIGDQGATVVGRLLDGERSGRIRLRDRIVALLSRYGLRARDVRVNGVPLSNNNDSRSEEL
jgi:hypothetical protein